MTAAAWVTSVSAAVQAIAACVLVGITVVYVHHTRTLAEEAQRQAQQERRHRREFAVQAIRYELLEIVRCCTEGRRGTPVCLPTHAWDSLKGDIAVLGLNTMAELAMLYSAVRESNSQYDQYISKPDPLASEPFFTRWNEQKDRVLPQAKKLGIQIAQVDLEAALDAADRPAVRKPKAG